MTWTAGIESRDKNYLVYACGQRQ